VGLGVARPESRRELGVDGEDERVRLEPFAEVEIELGDWWDAGTGGA
jgi:hypothetical protein